MTVGVPKESFPLEKRVAATPESVGRLVQPGFSVIVEDGAGQDSFFSNADYEAVGAKIVGADDVWKQSDIVLKLRPPTEEQIKLLDQRTLISFLYPRQNEALVKQLQDQKATAFAMDCIPRTLSRGQTYDALSSQANISGYRAVLEASNVFGRFFAGQMTAAGKVPPAKVLVIGTGVAGLVSMMFLERWRSDAPGFLTLCFAFCCLAGCHPNGKEHGKCRDACSRIFGKKN
jgi:NAD(P) transhydrogenase